MLSLDIISTVMIFMAVFIIMRTVFEDEEKYKAQDVLEEENKPTSVRNLGIVIKYSQPFFKRYILPAVTQMKIKEKMGNKYKRPIANAGLHGLLSTDELISFKLFLVLGFPIIFIILRTFLNETWSLSLIPIIAILGFFYPDIWIKGLKKKRNKEITKGFPFVIDMLALSIEAGLDFISAMQKVVNKSPPGPIVDEFKSLINETRIGTSRADALRKLSWKANLPIMTSFCATLIAADSVGASIGPILKTLSGEVRLKRSNQIEEEGSKNVDKNTYPYDLYYGSINITRYGCSHSGSNGYRRKKLIAVKIIVKEKNIILGESIIEARSLFDRIKGLMFKKDFVNFDGMMLLHCNSIHTFFMKMPIHAIFLSNDNKIIKIYQNLKPWRITPMIFKARKVLEISTKKNISSVEPGDFLEVICSS